MLFKSDGKDFDTIVNSISHMNVLTLRAIYDKYKDKGSDKIVYGDISFNLSRLLNRTLSTKEINTFAVVMQRKYKEMINYSPNIIGQALSLQDFQNSGITLERFTCTIISYLYEAMLKKALTFTDVASIATNPAPKSGTSSVTNDKEMDVSYHLKNMTDLVDAYFKEKFPYLKYSVTINLTLTGSDKPTNK